MRKLIALIVLAVSLALPGLAQAHWYPTPPSAVKNARAVKKINHAQMNVAHARYALRALYKKPSGKYKTWRKKVNDHRWLLHYNLRRIDRLKWQTPPPHESAWWCIHRHEGAWNDANDPYWGGLQMDRTFMLQYAPKWLLKKGWANAWSIYEQMWVAEIAAFHRGRGFYPWPNTARMCGLI